MQACPPPHWLLAVQALHAPLMHAKPLSCPGPPYGSVLQSSKVEQDPHVLLMQVCPPMHSVPGIPCAHPVFGPGAQTPEEQVSPEAQSVDAAHVHCIPVCVAVHWAVDPHWLFVVHV